MEKLCYFHLAGLTEIILAGLKHELQLPQGALVWVIHINTQSQSWLSFLVKVGNSTPAAEPLSPLL